MSKMPPTPEERIPVPIDTISLIAGVDFGSVQRVMHAMRLILEADPGQDVERLLDPNRVPLISLAQDSNPDRALASRRFVQSMVFGQYAVKIQLAVKQLDRLERILAVDESA